MKGLALASAVAALNVVSAASTKSQQQPPTRRGSDLPKISVSGNGLWSFFQLALSFNF
jgi:hypothetical protein